MARRLVDFRFENNVRRDHSRWKHIDATIAALGEALFYAGITVPGIDHDREVATSRPLVSYYLNVLGKDPMFGMGMETCSMHDFLPPSRNFDEKMDGCRFRDDAVSRIMSRGPDIPAGSGEHFEAVDRDLYFYPIKREDGHGRSWAIDGPKAGMMLRLLSAYPDKVATIFPNDKLASDSRMVDRVTSEIESMIAKSPGDEKRTKAILKGIGTIMGFAPGAFIDGFAKTKSVAVAKEVVKEVARFPTKRKTRWDDPANWATNDFVTRIKGFSSPIINDAVADLINNDGKTFSGIDRCDVALEIVGGRIKASDGGYQQAKKYFDASCQHKQP
jgi:hypothetical protein